jgi:hypothetical protein
MAIDQDELIKLPLSEQKEKLQKQIKSDKRYLALCVVVVIVGIICYSLLSIDISKETYEIILKVVIVAWSLVGVGFVFKYMLDLEHHTELLKLKS